MKTKCQTKGGIFSTYIRINERLTKIIYYATIKIGKENSTTDEMRGRAFVGWQIREKYETVQISITYAYFALLGLRSNVACGVV